MSDKGAEALAKLMVQLDRDPTFEYSHVRPDDEISVWLTASEWREVYSAVEIIRKLGDMFLKGLIQ